MLERQHASEAARLSFHGIAAATYVTAEGAKSAAQKLKCFATSAFSAVRSLTASQRPQNFSFNENCAFRGSVPNRVVTPKSELVGLVFGSRKFGRFQTLYTSARTCNTA
jgi:hypothetical protein